MSAGTITCPTPEIRHGRATYTSRKYPDGIARFTCNFGYFRRGPESSRCGHDGEWEEKPRCLRKLHLPLKHRRSMNSNFIKNYEQWFVQISAKRSARKFHKRIHKNLELNFTPFLQSPVTSLEMTPAQQKATK